MPDEDGDNEREQPASSYSSSEAATRFLGLLISAVMAEARVRSATAPAAALNGLQGHRMRPPPSSGGGGEAGAFARRQRRYEELVLASFFGLQGVACK